MKIRKKKPRVSKNPFSPYVIHAIKGRSWRASSDHAARKIQQLSFENVPKMLQIMMRFLTEISENLSEKCTIGVCKNKFYTFMVILPVQELRKMLTNVRIRAYCNDEFPFLTFSH